MNGNNRGSINGNLIFIFIRFSIDVEYIFFLKTVKKKLFLKKQKGNIGFMAIDFCVICMIYRLNGLNLILLKYYKNSC